jgi:NTE family protein
MSAPDGRKVALVLSGGGANGAYEVGVIKALVSGRSIATGYQPLQPDIITGTSIGAFNAAFLVSQWETYGAAAVANLEQFWLDRLAGTVRDNGVFRLRANPFSLLDPTGYFPNPLEPLTTFLRDSGYLAWEGLQRAVHFATGRPADPSIERRLLGLADLSMFISLEPLERTLLDLDYPAIQRSPIWLKIAATNWATGELRVFWNRDMTEAFGPAAIRASTAVPGIFPPAEFGAQPFVDGSILMNAPLSPAIHGGAEILHVIYLDPDIRNIPLDHLPQAYNTVYRIFQINWAAAYNDDIGDAARINRTLAALALADRELPDDERTAALLRGVAQTGLPGQAELRPLEIHRYHPSDPMSGDMSLLNFDRDRVEGLIERGFQDAIRHDHLESGDVMPGDEHEASAGAARPPRRIL